MGFKFWAISEKFSPAFAKFVQFSGRKSSDECFFSSLVKNRLINKYVSTIWCERGCCGVIHEKICENVLLLISALISNSFADLVRIDLWTLCKRTQSYISIRTKGDNGLKNWFCKPNRGVFGAFTVTQLDKGSQDFVWWSKQDKLTNTIWSSMDANEYIRSFENSLQKLNNRYTYFIDTAWWNNAKGV